MNPPPNTQTRFSRHPTIPELWLEIGTGTIWTSKVGTNSPVVLDHPVRVKNQRLDQLGYLIVSTRRRGMTYPVRVHRVVVECLIGKAIPAGMVVDHIDGDRTNNATHNLRVVRPADNCRNMRKTPSHNQSSGMIGVCFYRRTGRWKAHITINNRHCHLGYFATREEAREAYLKAKKEHHGIPISNLDSRTLVLSQ
jgi:hypothetical protein